MVHFSTSSANVLLISRGTSSAKVLLRSRGRPVPTRRCASAAQPLRPGPARASKKSSLPRATGQRSVDGSGFFLATMAIRRATRNFRDPCGSDSLLGTRITSTRPIRRAIQARTRVRQHRATRVLGPEIPPSIRLGTAPIEVSMAWHKTTQRRKSSHGDASHLPVLTVTQRQEKALSCKKLCMSRPCIPRKL